MIRSVVLASALLGSLMIATPAWSGGHGGGHHRDGGGKHHGHGPKGNHHPSVPEISPEAGSAALGSLAVFGLIALERRRRRVHSA
jgi:hypothetical protein